MRPIGGLTMRISSLAGAFGAAILLLLAASDVARAESLQSAMDSCLAEFDDDLSDADPAACDGYVDAAKQAQDGAELWSAYSFRSLLWQSKGKLDLALRDADLAIELDPDTDFGRAWRATLIGYGGDYQGALAQLMALEQGARQKDFYHDMALFEYLVGNPAKAVEWYRAAAEHAAQVDQTQERAIEFRFQAALIEYEMKGGDLAPLKAFDVPTEGSGMVRFLHEFYVENKPDANALAFLRLAKEKGKDVTCAVYFAIGHRNAIAGNVTAAKPALETSADHCLVDSFEYHAAKVWLQRLST